jgi:hypothetical protein
VDKIKEIKQKRQVIVVTHNANIPVNGDAEYVISMSSDTHNLKIQAEGTIERTDVKQEICEVMEGGIDAFRTRARRRSEKSNFGIWNKKWCLGTFTKLPFIYFIYARLGINCTVFTTRLY